MSTYKMDNPFSMADLDILKNRIGREAFDQGVRDATDRLGYQLQPGEIIRHGDVLTEDGRYIRHVTMLGAGGGGSGSMTNLNAFMDARKEKNVKLKMQIREIENGYIVDVGSFNDNYSTVQHVATSIADLANVIKSIATEKISNETKEKSKALAVSKAEEALKALKK